jgi:hypothetical protein
MSYLPQFSGDQLARLSSFAQRPDHENPFSRAGNQTTIMPNGEGGFMEGDLTDFYGLQQSFPDKFNTTSLTEALAIPTLGMTAGESGRMGMNVSADVGLNVGDTKAQVFRTFWTPLVGEEQASAYASSIYSKDRLQREVDDLYGRSMLFARPAYQGENPGEDFDARWGFDGRYTYGALAEKQAETTGQDPVEILHQMKFIDDARLKAVREGKADPAQILEAAHAKETLAAPALDRFDMAQFPEIMKEAEGLGGYTEKAFVYEQAMKKTVKAMHHLMVESPDSPEELANILAQMDSLSEVVGPDFVNEAMQHVRTPDGWQEQSWEELDPMVKTLVEKSGVSPETLAQESSNPYSYLYNANMLALKKSSDDTREMMYEKDFHDGWFEWSNRLKNGFYTDFVNDPYAMYFAVPSIAAGVGTGILAGATSGTTALGKTMAFTAIDGLAAGLAEGYAAGVGGQTTAFIEGDTSLDLDWSSVYTDMALYGGMGAIGGGGLAGIIGGIGPTLRGGTRTAAGARSMVARSGVVGDRAKQAEMMRIAAREATVQETEGFQLFPNIQNQGLIVRLNRGEVEAKTVLNEVIPGLVSTRKGQDISMMTEDLFSSRVLAENNMSPMAAVDLVFGIQRQLGVGGRIGSEEFDVVVRAAFKEASAQTGDLAGDSANRIRLIDSSLKASDAGAGERFVGGSGRQALSGQEAKELTALLEKAAAKPMKKKQLARTVSLALRQNDEESLNAAVKVLKQSGLLGDTERAMLDERVAFVVKRGSEARKDEFLGNALRVETALKLLENETTIRVAQELGAAPRRIMEYIDKYKGLVGNTDGLAKLDAEYPDIRQAIDSIAGGEGLRVLNELPSSFNVRKFLAESEVTEDIRKYVKLRKALTRDIRNATDGTLDETGLASRIGEVAMENRKKFVKLAKKLGIRIDVG